MKRRIATIVAAAALIAGATVATTASARDSFSVSIGVPGFAVGYASPSYYYGPPVAYGPPAYYYGAPAVYAAPPVYYGPRYAYGYYRPYHHHYRYWYR